MWILFPAFLSTVGLLLCLAGVERDLWTMRSRDHDVVVVRHTINLGYWEFVGREWGGVKKGEVSLRVT
jgi:hypothetical protein